jgi:hypothetical protein
MVNPKKLTFPAIAALGLVVLVGGARASEVLYDEIPGGTVTITATDLTNSSTLISLSNNTWGLTNGAATNVGFDAAGLTLDSFVFTTSGSMTITSPAIVAGTTVQLASVSLNSTGAAPVTNLGGGDYQFTGAGATVSAMYSINNGTQHTLTGGGTTGLGGTIGIGPPDTLGVNGITMGIITVDGQQISLAADISFNGAQVPLPATAWLFTSGLALLGLPMLRRRNRTPA